MKTTSKELGSEVFETSIIKTDECVIFCLAAKDNCDNKEQILEDLHMIDDMLHMKRLYFATLNHNRYTRAGNVRKNSTLTESLMRIVESRIK